jgi:hypothetical protein
MVSGKGAVNPTNENLDLTSLFRHYLLAVTTHSFAAAKGAAGIQCLWQTTIVLRFADG